MNFATSIASIFCCSCHREEGAIAADVVGSSSVLGDHFKEEVLQQQQQQRPLSWEYSGGLIEDPESEHGDASTIAAELVSNAAGAAADASSSAVSCPKASRDVRRTYQVALNRTAGRSLGLSFKAPGIEQLLVVDCVYPGDTQIATWNERQIVSGGIVVEQDHCIIEVGGRRCSPAQMLDALAHDREGLLSLTLLAPERISATLLKSPGDRLGVSLLQSGQLLIVESVADGLVRSWNQAHPEQQVQAGDCIVEVCGRRGDPQALLSRLLKEFCLFIKLIRLPLPL